MQQPENHLNNGPVEGRDPETLPGLETARHPAEPSSHTHVPTHWSRNTGSRVVIIAALLAIGLLVGFVFVREAKSRDTRSIFSEAAAGAQAPPVVDVVAAQASPRTQNLALPGETSAWFATTIYARVNGYVGNWTADIGDRVHKGDVLATIETPEVDAELVAAQAKLKASDADVLVEEANAAFAKSTYDRYSGSPVGSVSAQEIEQTKASNQSSIARVVAAQAQVNLDQAEVDRLSALTEFKKVVAPFDGTITARQIDIGNLVTAGSTANTTPLYSLAQYDRIRVFVDVPEVASVGISNGMQANVTSDAHPSQVFTGQVARTASAIDTKSRTLKVEVDIPNQDFVLVPGMYVHVNFQCPQPGKVQIPASAIIFRSNGPQVAVVDDNDHVTFQNVTIASDLGDAIELGSGISAGQKVVLNISDQVVSGDLVSIAPATQPVGGSSPPPAQPAAVAAVNNTH